MWLFAIVASHHKWYLRSPVHAVTLYPAETPEAWLLAKEHGDSNSSKLGSRKQKLRVPYLGLEVTPELVAISMGALCWLPGMRI
jgi:hypothetical protein